MTAPGVTELTDLIRSMTPTLDPTSYVYVDFQSPSLAPHIFGDPETQKAIQMLFREDEGWTGIVKQDFAEKQKLTPVFPCRRITLNVYSSLDAVGFLAAVTRKLAELKIGVNPVSACLHDHLFVPVGTEEAVMGALQEMVKSEMPEGK